MADTIDIFYGAADKGSEGAMAAHAYKRAVEDLDTGVARELASPTCVYLVYRAVLIRPICHSRTPHTALPLWNRWVR